MKKYGAVIVLVVLVGAVFIFKQAKNKKENKLGPTLKIGISLPLTGSIAHFGESAKKGVMLASEEFIQNNPGFNLKYYVEDNAFTGKAAVSAYRKLKDSQNIDAVITASSPATLATEPLAKSDSILQMAIFSSTPKYSSPNDLSFRVFPRAEKEAKGLVKYLEQLQLERTAILYINNDFGQGVLSSFKQILAQNASLQVVSEESYLPETSDFRTQLAKIKAVNPQALVLVATAPDTVNIMRQAKALNLQILFLATSSASDPAVLNTVAETEGLLVTDIFDVKSSESIVQDFVRNYQVKFGVIPDLYAAQGYDGYKLTALALKNCGRDAQCVKDYLFNLKNYSTILGSLNFDNNGDPDYEYFVKVFKNGSFEKIK